MSWLQNWRVGFIRSDQILSPPSHPFFVLSLITINSLCNQYSSLNHKPPHAVPHKAWYILHKMAVCESVLITVWGQKSHCYILGTHLSEGKPQHLRHKTFFVKVRVRVGVRKLVSWYYSTIDYYFGEYLPTPNSIQPADNAFIASSLSSTPFM